jgi:hypothetical protein
MSKNGKDQEEDKAGSLVASLKRDVVQSVTLYFAPVRAVVDEFSRAVERISHEPVSRRHDGKHATH